MTWNPPPLSPDAAASYRLSRQRWIIALAVMSAAIMELLDTSVVNVSLPYIAGNLSAPVEQATWVLTSYLVANAIVLPMSGWLASRIGRRHLLMFSIGGFTAASLLCGLAPTLPWLVAFRVAQGACGGFLQPLSRAILLETFPREERGKAMALWGAGIVAAPILAPALGGWLTADFNWRWVFFINLPVGIYSWSMVYAYIHDPHYLRRQGKIDGWGLGLLALGIAALQIMLDKGQEDDWFGSRFIVTLCVIAVVMLLLFVWRQLTVRHPIVHLHLLRYRSFAVGASLGAVLGFVLFGSLVLLPLFMQQLLNFSPLQAGIWTSPRGLGSMLLMPVAGYLLGRAWDSRWLLFAGFTGAGAGLLMFSHMNLNTGYMNLLWPQLVMGAALAFTFVPMSTLTVDPIPNEEMGFAVSITALLRNLGASVGISVAATLLARRAQFHQARLTPAFNPYNPVFRQQRAALAARLQSSGFSPFSAGRHALALLYAQIQQQASVMSYLDAFHLMAWCFFLAAPLVFLMHRARHQQRQS